MCLLLVVAGTLADLARRAVAVPQPHTVALRLTLSPDERTLYVVEQRSSMSRGFTHPVYEDRRLSAVDTQTASFVGEPVTIDLDGDADAIPRLRATTGQDGARLHAWSADSFEVNVFDGSTLAELPPVDRLGFDPLYRL
nr:hypothetical protein [Micromonospora sp. DSM 115978]